MKKNTDQYTYRVTWSAEDNEHVGLCVELPGLSWLAKSPARALSGIRKVVENAVADMEANGEETPAPLATQDFSGKFVVRIPPSTHRRLKIEAAEAGVSLNRLIASKLS